MNRESIVQLLESKNVQASYHRLKILEYLVNHRTHPTVDTIYRSLEKEIPTLSRTTVYNTLKVLVAKKIVSQVTVEENEVRYDYSGSAHLHFKCRKCGVVYDIFHDCELLSRKEIEGHIVDEYHMNFRGTCKKCAEAARAGAN